MTHFSAIFSTFIKGEKEIPSAFAHRVSACALACLGCPAELLCIMGPKNWVQYYRWNLTRQFPSCCKILFLPKCRTLHLSLLKFTGFLLGQPSSLARSQCPWWVPMGTSAKLTLCLLQTVPRLFITQMLRRPPYTHAAPVHGGIQFFLIFSNSLSWSNMLFCLVSEGFLK